MKLSLRRLGLVVLSVVITSCARTTGPVQLPSASPASPATMTPTHVPPSASPLPTATLSATDIPSARLEAGHDTFSMTGEQAQEVAVFMAFLHAYNNGQFEEALASLSEHVIGSDCDYRNVKTILFRGKSQAADWLRERQSESDHLLVSQIYDQNPDPSGAHVLGVTFSKRTSRTLTALGFADGITLLGGAKVVFETKPTLISVFANASVGGGARMCRPA